MTAQEFKKTNRIEDLFIARGHKLVGAADNRTSNHCPVMEHKASHLCVSVCISKQLWNCNDCKKGGDIITWMAIESGRSEKDVVLSLLDSDKQNQWRPISAPKKATPENNQTASKVEKVYSYKNQFGDEVFRVVRMIPKSFRQAHKGKDGKWVWNMDGVERVLYRIPEIMVSDTIVVVEGERDADNLSELGYCATCNVGGAGKWLDGYTETLSGKDVILIGDNDAPGKEHVKKVFDSIAGKAKSVKIVKIPETFKDVTEYRDSFVEALEFKSVLDSLIESAVPYYSGVQLPVYSMSEIEPAYRSFSRLSENETFSLSRWIPSLGCIRRLMPGELILVIGDTGAGKTALLQNIALSALPLPTLMFEIELPRELLFERFVSCKTALTCEEVERTYGSGDELGTKALDHHFKNLFICEDANLTTEKIEKIILKSELKIGSKPKLVIIDYVQLIRSTGEGRYEKASNVAEDLKRIARSTGTVIIVASQRSRPEKQRSDKSPPRIEVGLHDAKESGSLENSSGVVIGAWRDRSDASCVWLRVLKSTKGGAGKTTACNFNGEHMKITERANCP